MSIAVSLTTPNTHTLPLDSYQINTYIEYHEPMISNFGLQIILSKKVECRLQTIYTESATGECNGDSPITLPSFFPTTLVHSVGAPTKALQRSVTARPCSRFLTYIY